MSNGNPEREARKCLKGWYYRQGMDEGAFKGMEIESG